MTSSLMVMVFVSWLWTQLAVLPESTRDPAQRLERRSMCSPSSYDASCLDMVDTSQPISKLSQRYFQN